jgi:8-oxo-dGTP pyrophosphatase MutT (NUDIX family)
MKKKKDIYLNKKLQTRHSAGGISINDKAEILFCHPTNSNWNNWKMPKGQVDNNDSILDTAIREVYEETGWECDIIQEIKTKPVKKSFFWKKNKKKFHVLKCFISFLWIQ